LRLLVIAVITVSVRGRLGTGELEVASYFGEAKLTPVNAESNTVAPEAPKLPILLTQASLQSGGAPVKEEPAKPSDGFDKVCERTRVALSAQADHSALPSGPVYKECMAALAPLRNAQQDSDAVDTLSDCMALVNALVANKDCQYAVGIMKASEKPSLANVQPVVPAPQAVVAVASKVTVKTVQKTSAQVVAKQEEEALDLVSEAMTSVCTETVRDAEVGIKSEGDAMKVADAVAPICQEKAKTHLGAEAAATTLTKEWCHQLDGRLTIALETGFFFALSPDEAERQAAEPNPYASETRRKFCGRFIKSLRTQAQNGALYLNGAPPAAVKSAPAAKPAPVVAAVAPVPVAQVAVVAPVAVAVPVAAVVLPTIPPAPKAAAVVEVAPPTPVALAKKVVVAPPAAEKPLAPMNFPKGGGVDMLRLVQALSVRTDWNDACTGMISRLTSVEGSVTEEYALGDAETSEGTKVLTFNAADQGQIRKCAAQMKVLAIQSGIIGDSSSTGASKKKASFVSTGNALNLAEDAEALMDSPWAQDACADIAHGFLTAHLAHPGLEKAEYCPLYARDLRAMHAPLALADRRKQEMQQLRKRAAKGSLKRHMAQAQALAAPKQALRAPVAQVKRAAPAALITETAQTSAEEEKEGLDFWSGMMN